MKNKKETAIMIFLSILGIIFSAYVYYSYKVFKIEKNFYLLGKEEINVEYGEEFIDPGVFIDSEEIKPYISLASDVDTQKVGSYTINYTLNYSPLNSKKSIQRKVNIVDTKAPILEIEEDKEIYISPGETFKMPKYTATDNYDGDITKKVDVYTNVDTSKNGNYKITFTVTDSSGNKTTNSVDVIVQEKFEHTYIEISISNQKLNYYQKNKLVLSSDVVTGYNNWTPTGEFSVLNKARNIYLVGQNYRSFVQYWIAFKGINYGMHDASWRNAFGGEIYKTNGSHGCVNMPIANAKKLYELVEIGTPVYIKK